MKYTQIQQNHITQMYVCACVFLYVCVPTMVPVALATGALPPNTLVRQELPHEIHTNSQSGARVYVQIHNLALGCLYGVCSVS